MPWPNPVTYRVVPEREDMVPLAQSNGKERRLGQLERRRDLKGEVELKKLQEDKEYKEREREGERERALESTERISDEGATVDQTYQ